MLRSLRSILVLAAILCLHANTVLAQTVLPKDDYVVVCPINGEIDDGVMVLVQRAVEEAKNAKLIVFVVDTPGGRVDSAIEITKSILSASCPTVAYVEGMGAISAGAIISYACDDIIMGPASNIGASTPIMMGIEVSDAVNEKSMSFVRAKYRALGEETGHDPLLGEAMVDSDIELYGMRNDDGTYTVYKVEEGKAIGVTTTDPTPTEEEDVVEKVFESLGEELPMDLDGLKEKVQEWVDEKKPSSADSVPTVADENSHARTRSSAVPPDAELISSKGKLLTLSSSEAVNYGLAKTSLRNTDAVIAHYGFGALTKHKVTPNWAESLFAFLTSPTISGLLLMCAMGGIYVEVRTPGFGLPGIIGVTCLAIFFGSHMVIGLAGWLDLLLIGIGWVLIVTELFVLPGFGFVGAAGIVSLLAGLYLSLTRVTFPQYAWDFDRLTNAGQTVTIASVVFIVLNFLMIKVFPKTPLFNMIVLSTAQDASDGYTVQTDDKQRAVGLRGVTLVKLHPSGRGRFEGKTYDIVTRGEFIEADEPIEIIQVEGNRYVVTAIAQEHTG